jgi:uncharacterized protein (TIGR03546 family)
MVINQLTNVRNFFKTLNSGNIDEVCLGFVLGMFLGLIPLSINSVIFVLLLFILKVDKVSGVLATFLFGALGFLIDPLAHLIGYYVLVKVTFLKSIWTAFYNMPLIPFTSFNNTVVMGNTVIGLIIVIPVYIIVKRLIPVYRASKLKVWTEQIFENKYLNNINKLFSLFDKFKQFQGAK